MLFYETHHEIIGMKQNTFIQYIDDLFFHYNIALGLSLKHGRRTSDYA